MPEYPDIVVYIERLESLLADRALSRLLKKDWPKTVEELEARIRPDAQDSKPKKTSVSDSPNRR